MAGIDVSVRRGVMDWSLGDIDTPVGCSGPESRWTEWTEVRVTEVWVMSALQTDVAWTGFWTSTLLQFDAVLTKGRPAMTF